jgi:DNA-binding IclR family transcriptional regulator
MQIIRDKSRQLAVPIYFTTLSFGERKIILQTTDSERKGAIIRNDTATGDFIYTKPTGRILVSYANSSQLNDILNRWGFPENRWDDIHDLPQLIRVREIIRRQGSCVIQEKDDLMAAAVPVKVERCNFLGALGLAKTVHTDQKRHAGQIVTHLQECAAQIAQAL